MAMLRNADVTEIIYPGARHEIFNETNKDEVLADTTAFLRTRAR
jgi:alpha-beta hydrolase superfamily lysophospholipase